MNIKKIAPLLGVLILGLLIGYGLNGKGGSTNGSASGNADEPKVLYWKAPMDPNFRGDKPGKSPMGMDLVPVYAGEDQNDASGVRISPVTVNNIGVRTERVRRLDLGREIDTVGFIGYDETKVSHIHMRVDGWIDELVVESEGERVKKGDVLFRLYSPALVNAQSELLQAIKNGRSSLIKATEERLIALGFELDQITALRNRGTVDQYVDVHAEQDGIVVKLAVAEKMYVTPGTTVFSIADLSSVWVLADVFESQAQWMKEGLAARVTTPFLPGEVREGVVDYVYPTIDPKTRTLKVRLKFENVDEYLKPDMYAEVSISGQPTIGALTIPRDALIRSGKSERVVLDIGDGQFDSAIVRAGIESGDNVEILSGLQEGQLVVVSGQFLIDSEASLTASLRRMVEPTDNGATPAKDMEMSSSADAEGKSEEDASKDLMGRGTINAVLLADHKVNLSHEPIPAIGWPAMTMDFAVHESIELSKVQEGSKVHFTLSKNGDGIYVIKTIRAFND
jgi:membrane fusion protein, copper/silver efflux system